MIVAYVIGPQTDFFLPLLGDISPLALALPISLGKNPPEQRRAAFRTALSGWGYDYGDPSKQRCLATTIAEIMLVNRSALLEQITFARLWSAFARR